MVYNHIPKVEANMTGASTSAAGKEGLVPAPSAGAANRYLRSDGAWTVPPDNNTTYSAGTGISLSGTAINNAGVRAVATGSTNGTISVNTNGTTANVAVKGLGSAAYTNSTAYATASHNHSASVADYTVTGMLYTKGGEQPYTHNALDSGTLEKSWKNIYSIYDRTKEVHSETRVIVGSRDGTSEAVSQVRINADNIRAFKQSTTDTTKLEPSILYVGGEISTASSNVLAGVSEVKLADVCITDSGNFRPWLKKNANLGNANYLWKQLYAGTTTISTSDRELKTDIEAFDERYENLFFDLQPDTFKFRDGDSGRTHSGFISQDVEEALEKNGLSAMDFAGFCKDQKTEKIVDENGEEKEIPVEGEYLYALRYEEFIALNTHMIQKAYTQMAKMQEEINNLKTELEALKGATK